MYRNPSIQQAVAQMPGAHSVPTVPVSSFGRQRARMGQGNGQGGLTQSQILNALRGLVNKNQGPRRSRVGGSVINQPSRATASITETIPQIASMAGPSMPLPPPVKPPVPELAPTTAGVATAAMAPLPTVKPPPPPAAAGAPPSQLASAAEAYMSALDKGAPDPTKAKGDIGSALIAGGLKMMGAASNSDSFFDSLSQGGQAGLAEYQASKANNAAAAQRNYDSQLARAAGQFQVQRALTDDARSNRQLDIDQDRVDVMRTQGNAQSRAFNDRVTTLSNVYRKSNPNASEPEINAAVWQALAGRKTYSDVEIRQGVVNSLIRNNPMYANLSQAEQEQLVDATVNLIKQTQGSAGGGADGAAFDPNDPMGLFSGP